MSSAAFSTRKVVLGEVIDIRDGTHDTPAYVESGIPLITSKNLSDGGLTFESASFISEEDHAQISKRSGVQKGDVLYGMIGTIGKPTLVEVDRAFSIKNIALFKQAVGVVDSKYLRWLLDSPDVNAQIARVSKGGTQKFVALGALRGLTAHLPPLEEQRRIAAILDQAETLRTQRRAALVQLDSLTQALFFDMFGDPVENPKGVTVCELQKLCTRITDGTHQSPKWVELGVPFLFISNIVDGAITFDTHKFISEETYFELTRRCPIEIGDVLYTTVGSYGNAAIVTDEKRFAFQRHIAHIKPDRSKTNSLFIAAMIQSIGVRRQVDKVAKGVAQKTVNLADLKGLTVLAPPLALQQTFATRIQAIESLKTTHRTALSELDALFASLQQRAFAGEL